MKKKLRFGKLGIFIATLLILFISSCNKEELLVAPESDLPSDLTLKYAEIPPVDPDDMVCDLIAGKKIIVGKVIYSHDEDNMYVEYLASHGWNLSELHLYVGTLAGLPVNKKAVQIGHFPYSASNLESTTEYLFTIPLSELNSEANGFTIAAHAVVVKNQSNYKSYSQNNDRHNSKSNNRHNSKSNDRHNSKSNDRYDCDDEDTEETAWANCTYKPVIAVKSAIKDGFWAVSDGDFIPNPDNFGCRYFATNTYEKGDMYSLIGPYYPTPGQAGIVNVTDDGMSLLISVKANVGLKLSHTYLYVGTMPCFMSYINPSTCVNYSAFPFQVDTPDGEVSHIFTLPLPNVSFEKAFGSKRWGWINHFYFYRFD